MDKVEHFEIPADDPERATRFYTTVFGWELNPVPGVSYTRLLTKRVGVQDLYPRPFEVNGAVVRRDKVTTTPVVTISISDMDATIKLIPSNGGTVLVGKTPFGPPDKPRGYTAYFKDTEGNTMGLWQPAMQP